MIEQSVTKVSYTGDGSTKVFPFSFPFNKASDIHAAIYDSSTEATTELTSDYYVDTSGKKFCYPGYPPGQEPAASQQPAVLKRTQTITIYRQTEISQLTDLGDKYPLPNIEAMGDKSIMILQEHNEQLARCVKTAISDTETPEQRYLEMQTYVSATRQSAAEAASSAGYAQDMANDAAASEHNAATSASSAKASAQAAAQSAGDAGDAANRAKSSAIDAAGMLSQTAAYANQADQKLAAVNAMSVPAWDPFTSYSYPAVVAYTDGNTYRCIGQNIPPGTIPYNSSHWVRISVLGGDDFFDIDEWGGIMPRNYPTYSAYWSLDETGGIMPKGTEDEIIDATTTPAERAAAAAAASASEAASSATAASNDAASISAAAATATAKAAEATAAAKRAEDAQYLETDSDGNVTFKATT